MAKEVIVNIPIATLSRYQRVYITEVPGETGIKSTQADDVSLLRKGLYTVNPSNILEIKLGIDDLKLYNVFIVNSDATFAIGTVTIEHTADKTAYHSLYFNPAELHNKSIEMPVGPSIPRIYVRGFNIIKPTEPMKHEIAETPTLGETATQAQVAAPPKLTAFKRFQNSRRLPYMLLQNSSSNSTYGSEPSPTPPVAAGCSPK